MRRFLRKSGSKSTLWSIEAIRCTSISNVDNRSKNENNREGPAKWQNIMQQILLVNFHNVHNRSHLWLVEKVFVQKYKIIWMDDCDCKTLTVNKMFDIKFRNWQSFSIKHIGSENMLLLFACSFYEKRTCNFHYGIFQNHFKSYNDYQGFLCTKSGIVQKIHFS